MKLLPLAALLLILPMKATRGQALAAQDQLAAWGTVERLYPGHRLLVRTDSDHRYEVRAGTAPIQLSGGDLGDWSDLRVGQKVDVFGTLRGDGRVDASRLRITGASDDQADRLPSGRRADLYRDDQALVVTGTVASVDPVRESFRLRTARGLRTVELFDETRLAFSSGEPAGLRDLHAGDTVRVFGDERDGRLVADRVTLLGPSRAGYAEEDRLGPDEAIVVGTVRRPTYELNRQVKIRTARGDLSVDVDRDTPIYKYDDRVSVHELETGDRVRVSGIWTGRDRLRARRIDVEPPRQRTLGYRSDLPPAPMPVITVIGQLVSYDENRERMRLSTSQGDRIIVAKGTPAFLRGQRISRRDFRQGDRVRATGYWNGREIMATRVELAF